MSEKIKAVLKDEKKISRALFIGILIVAMIVIFDLPALFNAYASQIPTNSAGYTGDGVWGYGYGYWEELSPSLALTYKSGCTASCQYTTNESVDITATFGSFPAGVPLVSVDLPGVANDVGPITMSGSGTTWVYEYTTANVSTTSTATVTIQTLGGQGSTPTPSNNTFSITVAGGGASSGSVYYDTTAPAISNIAVSAGTTEATVTWTTNESSLTWMQYGASTSYGSESKGTSYYTSHSVKLTGLTPGATYHYLVRSKDGSSTGNEGVDVDKTFVTYKTEEEAKKAAEEAKEEAAETTETAETTEVATTEEVVAETVAVVPVRPAKPDLTKERDGLGYFIKTTKKLPSTSKDWAVVHFIAYGTDNTASLTSAERKDIVTDFNGIYGHVPSDSKDWADVDSIATGVKPATRVLKAEQVALRDFTRVYGRLPNFKVEGDDLGMSYIAYKLRAATRDLTKEKAATSVFKAIYRITPTTSTHWAIVRALAYSGAKR